MDDLLSVGEQQNALEAQKETEKQDAVTENDNLVDENEAIDLHTEYDPVYDNTFGESLVVVYGSVGLVEGETETAYALKIMQPYKSAISASGKAVYETIKIPTLNETTTKVATTYMTLTQIIKLMFSQNDALWEDIDDVFKVLIHSDIDVSNSTNNKHIHFYDTYTRANQNNGFLRFFYGKQNVIKTPEEEPVKINLQILNHSDLESQIKQVRDNFVDFNTNARQEMADAEVERRILQCKNWINLPMFSDFKMLFNNEAELDDFALRFFKVLNYLFYLALRKQEEINELRGSLGSYQNALQHLKTLEQKILNADASTKIKGLNFSQIDESEIVYSTDIIVFGSWYLRLLNFITQLIFGNNINFFNNKHNKSTISLHDAVNESDNLMNLFTSKLKNNTQLVRNEEFRAIGLQNYTQKIIQMANEYGNCENIYYDLYFLYKNTYLNGELLINGKSYSFNDLQYFTWLMACLVNAVLRKYIFTQILYKYAGVYTLTSLNDLLKSYAAVPDYNKEDNEFIEKDSTWTETFKTTVEVNYKYNEIMAANVLNDSLNDFADKYSINDYKAD